MLARLSPTKPKYSRPLLRIHAVASVRDAFGSPPRLGARPRHGRCSRPSRCRRRCRHSSWMLLPKDCLLPLDDRQFALSASPSSRRRREHPSVVRRCRAERMMMCAHRVLVRLELRDGRRRGDRDGRCPPEGVRLAAASTGSTTATTPSSSSSTPAQKPKPATANGAATSSSNAVRRPQRPREQREVVTCRARLAPPIRPG